MNSLGLVHIYTGDGKGKTSASLGLALRAWGNGYRVLFIQFLKGQDTGELRALERLEIPYLRTDEVKKFIPYMNEEERSVCAQSHERCFQAAKQAMIEGQYDVVILDEVLGAVGLGLVSEAELLDTLRRKNTGTEVILTGRGPSDTLLETADYVSEIACVKHPYEKGIQARKGIEY